MFSDNGKMTTWHFSKNRMSIKIRDENYPIDLKKLNTITDHEKN